MVCSCPKAENAPALQSPDSVRRLEQRRCLAHLAKQHRHELSPTGETPRVPLGLVLFDCFLELTAREKFQHLRKDAA